MVQNLNQSTDEVLNTSSLGHHHTRNVQELHQDNKQIITTTDIDVLVEKIDVCAVEKKGGAKERRRRTKVISPKIEVPFYEFMEVEVEKLVEVADTVESVMIHEIPTPQYVEKIVKVKNEIQVTEDIKRRVPCPLEHVVQMVFTLPMIRPTFEEISVPLHLPRFIEVPFPKDCMLPHIAKRCELLAEKVQVLDQGGVSLCEIENIAATIRATHFEKVIQDDNMRQELAFMREWDNGHIACKAPGKNFALDPALSLKMIPNQAQESTVIISANVN